VGTEPGPENGQQALRDLLGAPRARLLEALRCPSTTTALARSLNVSPAAVSQHLAVLRRCDLVDRTRSGREVLYQTSDLGLALPDSPAVASFWTVAQPQELFDEWVVGCWRTGRTRD
jgi:DNA-binding transcriptional ArsR family regulator